MDKNDKAIRTLIADDHPVFCHGLRMLLEAEPDMQVVGEARDVREAVELVYKLKPDVLLLDLESSPEVLRQLINFSPTVRTILLAVATERQQIVQALQLGARGVVPKDAPTQDVINSIRIVMAGKYWIAHENISDLVQVLRRASGHTNGQTKQRNRRLTSRELEIVSAVAGAYTNKDIAKKFSLSEDTVKHHLTNIYDKLGVSNRLELAIQAIGRGLVPNQ